MSAEDEAIQLTMSVAKGSLEAAEKLVMALISLTAALGVAAHKHAQGAIERERDLGVQGITDDAGEVYRAAARGGGSVVGTTVDVTDFFGEESLPADGGRSPLLGRGTSKGRGLLSAEGRKKYDALDRILRGYGVGMAIEIGVPDDGKMYISFDARNTEALHHALCRAGLELAELGLADEADLPIEGEPAAAEQVAGPAGPAASPPRALPSPRFPALPPAPSIAGIPRGDDGGYPDRFCYAGCDFTRDMEDENVWVAPAPHGSRETLAVCLEGDSAEWSICAQDGHEMMYGCADGALDVDALPVGYYKRGCLVEADELGRARYLRDDEGARRIAPGGDFSKLHYKVPCRADDPDVLGMEVLVDLDPSSEPGKAVVLPAVPGKPLESAILSACCADAQHNVDPAIVARMNNLCCELDKGRKELEKKAPPAGLGGGEARLADAQRAAAQAGPAIPLQAAGQDGPRTTATGAASR